MKMSCQLPADCLKVIFELLEDDQVTLHSCLLVNRLWCEASVEILWRNIQDKRSWNERIFRTLIACLPNESKDILHKQEIFISTPTLILPLNPPLFCYASFCKVLYIGMIYQMTKSFFFGDEDKTNLLTQEILRMFMNQTTLKKLFYRFGRDSSIPDNITFTHFPGAKDCLANLTELNCNSSIQPEFFDQLSQICHNIQSLILANIIHPIPNGLKDLISSQNNLKYLSLNPYYNTNLVEIIPSFTKHSNTLIKLGIHGFDHSLSFINKFTNLHELTLSLVYFNDLQYTYFPQLQILKFLDRCPDEEMFYNFLKINGKNLKFFYAIHYNESLNLIIAKFCPNLKSLVALFQHNEIEQLKGFFCSCQKLESIEFNYLNLLEGKDVLEVVAEHSPENFHELNLRFFNKTESLSKDLESFFIRWKNRIPQKSISLIVSHSFIWNEEKKMSM